MLCVLFQALNTKDTVGCLIQRRFEYNATCVLYQALDTKDTVGCLIQRRFE